MFIERERESLDRERERESVLFKRGHERCAKVNFRSHFKCGKQENSPFCEVNTFKHTQTQV